MKGPQGPDAVSAAAVSLLCASLLWGFWARHPGAPSSHYRPFVPHWSPSLMVLMESKRHWIRAWNAIGEEQSQLEAWDPTVVASAQLWGPSGPSYKRELELADQSARRALALSRSKAETYRSTLWLARIECALGHHREELRLAKKLASLAPRDKGALTYLIHAAHCNGLTELEKQTITGLGQRSEEVLSHKGALSDGG